MSTSTTPPAEQIKEAVNETVDKTANFDWMWLLGAPLRIAFIIVGAVILNLVARKIIRKFAGKIADGSNAAENRRRQRSNETPRINGSDAIAKARRAQRAQTVGSMLSSIATIIIATLAIMMVLTELDFNLGPLLASAGIAGVAIGFGAQELVKDYLSGFFLVVEDQYGIGDTVDLGEAVGTVEEVGLRTTKVRGIDGTLWHVRNGEIMRVGNQSQGWARAVMDIAVPYDSDPNVLNGIIEDAVAELRADPALTTSILEDPEILGVQDLTGEAMTIRAFIKTKPNEQWAVARAFRGTVKRMMDDKGIRIPLAQQTIVRAQPVETTASASDFGTTGTLPSRQQAAGSPADTGRTATATAERDDEEHEDIADDPLPARANQESTATKDPSYGITQQSSRRDPSDS